MAGFSHLDRLVDAGFQVLGAPSCSSACNAERAGIDHVLAFRNITAFAKELRRRKRLGMMTTFWPTDAVGEVRWSRLPAGDETVDMCYRQVRPGLEAHWHSIWRGAECAWSTTPRPRQGYDRAFVRIFLGTDDTSYPDALALASFPMGGNGRRGRVSAGQKEARLRQAVVRMRSAQRAARRARPTVSYCNLFLRIQQQAERWERFHDDIPHV